MKQEELFAMAEKAREKESREDSERAIPSPDQQRKKHTENIKRHGEIIEKLKHIASIRHGKLDSYFNIKIGISDDGSKSLIAQITDDLNISYYEVSAFQSVEPIASSSGLAIGKNSLFIGSEKADLRKPKEVYPYSGSLDTLDRTMHDPKLNPYFASELNKKKSLSRYSASVNSQNERLARHYRQADGYR